MSVLTGTLSWAAPGQTTGAWSPTPPPDALRATRLKAQCERRQAARRECNLRCRGIGKSRRCQLERACHRSCRRRAVALTRRQLRRLLTLLAALFLAPLRVRLRFDPAAAALEASRRPGPTAGVGCLREGQELAGGRSTIGSRDVGGSRHPARRNLCQPCWPPTSGRRILSTASAGTHAELICSAWSRTGPRRASSREELLISPATHAGEGPLVLRLWRRLSCPL